MSLTKFFSHQNFPDLQYIVNIAHSTAIIVASNNDFCRLDHCAPFNTKLWQIAPQKHFGRKNVGRLAALHNKPSKIKLVGG